MEAFAFVPSSIARRTLASAGGTFVDTGSCPGEYTREGEIIVCQAFL